MYIYVASFSNRPGLIKVGCSKNVQHRMSVLSETHGEVENVWCKLVGENYYGVEKTIHVAMHGRRIFVHGDGGTEFFTSGGSFSKDCCEVEEIIENLGCSYLSAKNDKLITGVNKILDSGDHVTTSHRILLLALLMYSSADGVYGFGIEFLCKKTGLSRTTIFSTLNQLKDFGVVEKYDKKFYIIHIEKIADARHVTRAELDKRKEYEKAVDKPSPAMQQSSHQQDFSHLDYDDDEEFDTPF